jgi:hypothetical protein
MMKKMFWSSVILMLSYSNAFADPTVYQNLQISEVSTGWGDEAIYITVTPEVNSACLNKRFRLSNDALFHKEKVSMILVAYSTSSTVEIYSRGCVGTSDYIELSAITLK